MICDFLSASSETPALETIGSILMDRVPKKVVKIVDIKCPDSGMSNHFLEENLKFVTGNDELKFVLCSRDDYDWAKNRIREENPSCTIHMSPVIGILAAADLAKWILSDQLPVRLQLQQHKYIWPEETRGV